MRTGSEGFEGFEGFDPGLSDLLEGTGVGLA